jgi:ABC-type glutathione transport system ATPase component
LGARRVHGEALRFAAGFFFSWPADRIEARIDEMLELVGIADKADRPIKTLSGGETQRLGIAQAKIHEPDLLILDEPAAALDHRVSRWPGPSGGVIAPLAASVTQETPRYAAPLAGP